MNVILDELVKENSRLSERIKKLESNAVAFGKIHKVKKGDTLASIARKYGSSVEAIAQANGIPEDASIEIGQEILIPGTSP
jgi:LysM repeat protein